MPVRSSSAVTLTFWTSFIPDDFPNQA